MSGEKPVLATDWDDVWYEFLRYFFPHYNRLYGTDLGPHHVLDHDLTKLMPHTQAEMLEIINEFHLNGETVNDELMPTVQEVAPVLAQTYDIIVVTARPKLVEQRILEKIERYLPGSIAAVYHLEDYEQHGYRKGSFVRELGAVALVDDHIGNVLSAEAHGVRGLLFNMPKNIYHPLAIERVSDWYDVYEKLMGKPFNPTSPPSENAVPAADSV